MDEAACRAGVLAALQDVHRDAGVLLSTPEALHLDSLMVVALVDALETRFDIHLQARDVTPQALASLTSISALVRAMM